MPADPRKPARTAASPLRRRVLWTASALSCAVLATSGIGRAVVSGVGDSIGRVNVFGGLTHRPADDDAMNILVVGTDDRDGVPERILQSLHAGGEACHCTDTMMLVHLSASGDGASVVSIPRDSYVDIPAHQDLATRQPVPESMGKINAAYGMGGPPLTVETVEQATGLRIDHYLQLNFLSFVSTVDALGGVPVCTDRPLHDPKSGLDLPAGTTRLDGATALKYVRARYVDPTADLGRMQRQQKFVAQVIQQATGSGTLLNPLRLQRVLSSVLASVKADEGLSDKDLLALATRMKDLRPSSASFATVPLADLNHVVPGWGSTVLWDKPRAAALFTALREDRPLTPPAPRPSRSPSSAGSAAGGKAEAQPTVPPGRVRVQVQNGSGVAGLGARADRLLRAEGFATSGYASNAPGPDAAARTVVRYDPRWDESVRTLAAALPGAQLVPVAGLGGTMQVVLGKDFTGVAKVPVPKATTPAPVASSAAPTAAPTGAPPIAATRGDTVVCT
ncbi:MULTISPECIES: LCP family protein [Streptacidiphilus]|uniref:LCP family protein n=1 Tax=Streptacidiphilus cavernicola TaxID=3342716 RepID=A0ABV6US80_9ACTN|nr:LCP family protein [Streptacidiphilus jeojiense]